MVDMVAKFEFRCSGSKLNIKPIIAESKVAIFACNDK